MPQTVWRLTASAAEVPSSRPIGQGQAFFAHDFATDDSRTFFEAHPAKGKQLGGLLAIHPPATLRQDSPWQRHTLQFCRCIRMEYANRALPARCHLESSPRPEDNSDIVVELSSLYLLSQASSSCISIQGISGPFEDYNTSLIVTIPHTCSDWLDLQRE